MTTTIGDSRVSYVIIKRILSKAVLVAEKSHDIDWAYQK